MNDFDVLTFDFCPLLGVPEEQYNILIDFAFADVAYTLDSTPPDAQETFDIMSNAITTEYIMNVVFAMSGSPFANCNDLLGCAVHFGASEEIVQVTDPPQP